MGRRSVLDLASMEDSSEPKTSEKNLCVHVKELVEFTASFN